MKIIIVGGGKVGHQIGKKLTNEKHDVVIIDDDPDVLAYMVNTKEVPYTQTHIRRNGRFLR